MKSKEHFNRVTIEQMKQMKEQLELKKAIGQAIRNLDELVTNEAEKLAQELVEKGYDVDSFEIEAEHRWEGTKLIVLLKVVQEGKVLVFDIAEEIS